VPATFPVDTAATRDSTSKVDLSIGIIPTPIIETDVSCWYNDIPTAIYRRMVRGTEAYTDHNVLVEDRL
jgi:hypothetical protein